MKEFHIHDGQTEKGPFTLEQLESLSIKKDTLVWYEGLEQWIKAETEPELNKLFSSKPAPPPLTKTINESLAGSYIQVAATPPPLMQKQQKKTSYLLPVSAITILAIGVVLWLMFQNKRNSETISTLQTQVLTQEAEKQQIAEQEKRKEEEQRRINEAITAKNQNYRNNWQKYIKPDYMPPAINYTLGGISSFNVYVSNETEYMLDQVDVLVEYIRKNGDTWQTRTINLFNVAPNSVETVVAPSSVNGVRVNLSIHKIVSKKMHFCYPVGSGDMNDPYFCK